CGDATRSKVTDGRNSPGKSKTDDGAWIARRVHVALSFPWRSDKWPVCQTRSHSEGSHHWRKRMDDSRGMWCANTACRFACQASHSVSSRSSLRDLGKSFPARRCARNCGRLTPSWIL